MAWIQVHQELGRHPKTKRVARALQISIPAVIGHLTLLWWWAVDYAQDGVLTAYSDDDIADAAEWAGEGNDFVAALIAAHFVDRDDTGTYIHDWYDYAGGLIEQRKAQAEYKRQQTALYSNIRLTRAIKERDGDVCQYCGKTVNWNDRRGADGGTYDHIDPDSGNTVDNLVVCCRACALKKGDRAPHDAGMQLLSGGISSVYGSNTADNGRNNVDIWQVQADTQQITAETRQITASNGNSTVDNGRNTAEKPTLNLQLEKSRVDKSREDKTIGSAGTTTARVCACARNNGAADSATNGAAEGMPATPMPPASGDEAEAAPRTRSDSVPYKQIMNAYNSTCDRLRKIESIEGERKKAVTARFKSRGMEQLLTVFEKANASEFLCGGGEKNWRADFDWLMNPTNIAKVLEGKYDNDVCNIQTAERDRSPPQYSKPDTMSILNRIIAESEGGDVNADT